MGNFDFGSILNGIMGADTVGAILKVVLAVIVIAGFIYYRWNKDKIDQEAANKETDDARHDAETTIDDKTKGAGKAADDSQSIVRKFLDLFSKKS